MQPLLNNLVKKIARYEILNPVKLERCRQDLFEDGTKITLEKLVQRTLVLPRAKIAKLKGVKPIYRKNVVKALKTAKKTALVTGALRKKMDRLKANLDFIKKRQSGMSSSKFVGIKELKEIHEAQVKFFEEITKHGEWHSLAEHVAKSYSGFDWWMFPINRPSSYKERYNLGETDRELLKKDAAYMTTYRQGVRLVAASWGWDVDKKQYITSPSPEQKWADYPVRLSKMMQSLHEFGEQKLLDSMKQFIRQEVAKGKKVENYLESWARKAEWAEDI